MILVHYSKDQGFTPNQDITPGGSSEKGCFFYKEGEEIEWSQRYRTIWHAPDDLPFSIENQFDAGEYGNENEVLEIFVKAENLGKLT